MDLDLEDFEFSHIQEKGFTQDLLSVKDRLMDNIFAQEVYAAICNNVWRSLEDPDETFSCTWRYAGGLVAEVRDNDEDYMNYYCSGMGVKSDHEAQEGFISSNVRQLFMDIGWVENYDDIYAFKYNDDIYYVWIDRITIIGGGIKAVGSPNTLSYIKKHFPQEIRSKIQKWMFEKV